MINCVIFDCDGTLVDSEYLCNLGLKLKLDDYGVDVDASALMREFRGQKLSSTLTLIAERYQIKLRDDFIVEYRTLVDGLLEESLKPCEGAEALLKSIDLPMCVASNATKAKMHKALSITGLVPYFNDQLFSAYEVGAWKPDPALFLHVAQAMGFRPEECLVVEDSPVGVEAALLAGMKVVRYDPHSSEDVQSEITSITHLNELSLLLQSH